MQIQNRLRFALLAALVWPALCSAHRQSAAECIEGSDFIKNAALARDAGMTEARFIQQIRDDIEVIQGLPVQLRWLVQDEEDAELLLSAATEMFRAPKQAAAHQADFLQLCGHTSGKALFQL